MFRSSAPLRLPSGTHTPAGPLALVVCGGFCPDVLDQDELARVPRLHHLLGAACLCEMTNQFRELGRHPAQLKLIELASLRDTIAVPASHFVVRFLRFIQFFITDHDTICWTAYQR